ncbi:MAG: hypothetical protein CV087_19715 [Candidatus Brocadia sp. WS118]|nr:MAG: hypothetical protein CV087_19715 [Candidatus Brocadia sp. WS118]
MQRKTKPEKAFSTFRSYFQEQKLDNLVKNLLVFLPNSVLRTRNIHSGMNKMFAPLLTYLFSERRQMRRHTSIIDLRALNDTLALHLKNTSTRMVRMSDKPSFKFEKLNLAELLNKQEELLKELIAEQRKALQQQAKQILEEEQERIKCKFKRDNRRRT